MKKHIAKLLALSMAFAFFSVAVAQDKPEKITQQGYLQDRAESQEQTNKFMKAVGSKLCWKCCGKKINNGKEFINMKTTIIYERKGSAPEVRTFGESEESEASKASKRFLDPFPRNKPLRVNVRFSPEIQNKEMYSCEFGGVAVKDLLIPVEIRMEKADNITVEYYGGIVEDSVLQQREVNGWVTFRLFIKNNPDVVPEASFTITPANETADMKIKIIYGGRSHFVSKDCNITETIEFKKQ